MFFFKHKEKLIATPTEDLRCGCGFPIGPTGRTFNEGLFYRQVIVEHKRTCSQCGKTNTIYG